jgi:CRP/FNR family cyclic AMP-dependent transcriptional regulator
VKVTGLTEVVRSQPLFADLAPEHVELLAGCARNVRVAAGTRLLREGRPADRFYLLRRGRVAVQAVVPGRGRVVIETLGPGDVLGWSWLVPPYRWHFDAETLEPVVATAFDGACLRAKCDADPALGYALMRRFAQVIVDRLQHTRLRLLDLYGADGEG